MIFASGKSFQNSRMLRMSAPRQGIDRLVFVAHGADVVMAPRPATASVRIADDWCPDTRQSSRTGSAGCNSRAPAGNCFQESYGLEKKIVEIKRVGLAQILAVLLVYVGDSSLYWDRPTSDKPPADRACDSSPTKCAKSTERGVCLLVINPQAPHGAALTSCC